MKKGEIGEVLKMRRNFLNITQKDLSDISGVALRKLIDIENGKANPTLGTLIKLFDVLGLSLKVEVKL
ncbi:MAG: helix-turn-helix domain-containing protein [Bacteroidota bacterium]